MSAITNSLTGVIQWIYSLIHNHGWSIVIFTLLIRTVLMPLDISSRKGMRKMAKIQPQINALQKKYANDKAKLQQKQSELMRKERYNPLSGCLPLLIQMPILFAMFGAMRLIANEQIVDQVFTFLKGGTPQYEGWLWVKNIWMADSLFASVAPNLNALQVIGHDVWHKIWTLMPAADQQLVISSISQHVQDFAGAVDFSNAEAFKALLPQIQATLSQMPAYVAQTAPMPGFENINLIIFSLKVFAQFNGLLILPVLAGSSQLLMTKVNPQAAGQQPAAGGQGAGMGNFMKYFFPLFSVYITLTSNAGFALYWVTSNLIATAMSYFINLYYDRKDKLPAANELQEGTVK
ncbi:MAG: YidC/Oxa1 family membrane protein insertase [Clostridiales bacterium]|nr:YidC/Oxa1 family membrane protein insertase [Clostridiales bacterium]